MKAFATSQPGPPETLILTDIPDPQPKVGEVLIEVEAIGLNGADLLQRKGLYPPPKGESEIIGLEVSGTVVECPGKELRIGQRVMALLAGGGYAERVKVSSALAMPVPDRFDFIQAAAIPEVFVTAYLELVLLADLKKGERLLIHAGASGVGTAAIQIGRELGAEIFVTASSELKLAACRKLGAHHTINYREQEFDQSLLALTNDYGVDCILDLVGAAHWSKNIASLAINGRLLLVGLGGGSNVNVDLRALLAKRIKVIGSTLRSRSIEEKSEIVRRFWEFANDRFEDGRLLPVVDRVFPFEDAVEAHRYLESQANIGKVVLQRTISRRST